MKKLEVTVMSFGYKHGTPPIANLVFDVRFLKNPFWVEELKLLTGRDIAVQNYLFEQQMAVDFLGSVMHMLDTLLPKLEQMESGEFTIAFGCTGGQHRSATMVEALTKTLTEKFPDFVVTKNHRDLERNLAELEQRLAVATAEQLTAET